MTDSESIKDRLRQLHDRVRSAMEAVPKVLEAACTEDSEMSRKRMEVCRGCDKWTGHTCTICGCYTALKVRLASEACPIGKWSAEG